MKSKQEGSVIRVLSTLRGDSFSCVVAIVLCLLLMVGCQAGDDQPAATESQASSTDVEEKESSDAVAAETGGGTAADTVGDSQSDGSETQAAIPQVVRLSPEEGWAASAHSNSYVIDTNGRNDSCARCHSAAEWLPGPDDIPESCLTCKFDVDVPPPLISEKDWGHISCKVCHRMDGDEAEPEFTWLDIAVIEEYVDLESTTELCRKCHELAEMSDHKPVIELSEEHAELTCTQCHDAHATKMITCATSNCHEEVLTSTEPVAGHDVDHSSVSCWACHDAAGLEVGPEEESQLWVTHIAVPVDGEEILLPHSSHAFQSQVTCERCHFSANPWGLSEEVAGE